MCSDPVLSGSEADVCVDPVIPGDALVPARRPLVLDTNIVLDLFVFQDPVTATLRQLIADRAMDWIATTAMREELARVLDYPQIVRRLQQQAITPEQVLQHFDAQTRVMEASPKAGVTCKDPDDQKFIDLAVAHQALLLSKDQAVLCMAKRLAALGVQARATLV